MAERSSLTQTVQWGVETIGGPTSGTNANISMSAMGFEPSPTTEGGDFRPAGKKFKTLAWVGKEWSEGNISGQATYTEMIFPLASVLSAPTSGTPTAGTAATAYPYTFTSSATGPDNPRQFTVETGENGNRDRISGVLINEFSMSFTRDQVELSGSAFGRALANDTENLTTITFTPASVMLLPADVSVQWGTTYASITGAPTSGAGVAINGKLSRVMSVDFSISNRYNPVWVLSKSDDSYVASVEGEPDLQATIMMEANAEGMARLAELKASTTIFLRIRADSDTQISDSGLYYQFLLDLAGKVSDTGGYSDQDGVYAIEWTITGVYDSQLGSAVKAYLLNDIPYTGASGSNLVA